MRRLFVEEDNRIKPFEGAQVFHYSFSRFTGLAFVAAHSTGFFLAFVYARLGLIVLSRQVMIRHVGNSIVPWITERIYFFVKSLPFLPPLVLGEQHCPSVPSVYMWERKGSLGLSFSDARLQGTHADQASDRFSKKGKKLPGVVDPGIWSQSPDGRSPNPGPH